MQDNLYNLAFERSLLSSILFEPKQFDELGGLLNMDDFYLPSHAVIFNAMHILVQADKPICEEFLQKELIILKAFNEQVMLEILSANPISNTNAYVQEVKELSKLRKLLTITTTIKRCVVEEMSTSSETISEIEKQLMLLDESSAVELPVDMNVAINEYENMTPPPLIKIGMPEVDNLLCGGIESAQLVHVGGESNIGKTIFTKQVLKNVCEEHKVLFFSYEMPKWKMAKQLKDKNFKRGNYFIIDSRMMGTDVSDVVMMLRRMRRKHGIRFALVDSSMELSNKHFKGNSDVERKADIDRQLSRAANELDIVVFLITQISDANIQNGRMKSYGSTLSDYATDMKILLLKGDDSDVLLSIEKARQEATLYKKVPLWLNKETLEFTDMRVVETVYATLNESYSHSSALPSNDNIEITVI